MGRLGPQDRGANSVPERLAPGTRTCRGWGAAGGGAARILPAPTPRRRHPLPRAAPIGCGAQLQPAPRGRRGAPRARARCAATTAATSAAAATAATSTAGSTARLGLHAPPAPDPPRPPAPPRSPGAPVRPRAAATTPRAVLRVKNGAAKLPKPPAAAAAASAEAPGAGAGMERSQSRLSLSASFEALAIYFPCMNSFDDEDAGKRAARPRPLGVSRDPDPEARTPSRCVPRGGHCLLSSPNPVRGDAPGSPSSPAGLQVSRMRCLPAFPPRDL